MKTIVSLFLSFVLAACAGAAITRHDPYSYRTATELKEELADPGGTLLGGFLRKWQAENKGQSPAFLEGAQKNVADAFDQIIELENRKSKD